MSKIGPVAALAGFSFAAAPGCTVTPIDAVTELDGTGSTGSTTGSGSITGSSGLATTAGVGGTTSAGTGIDGVPGVGICATQNVPDPRIYFIVSASSGACLSAGDETDIANSNNATGYEAYLEPNCAYVDEQRWSVQDATFNFFEDAWDVEVRNQALDLNLDMEGNQAVDGVRAVLYTPHSSTDFSMLQNQRFQFIQVPGSVSQYLISPRHVENSCLQQMSDGYVRMYGCSFTVPAQRWQLATEACAE